MDMRHQLAALHCLTTKQLRLRYAEVFGEPTRANNKPWLIKRVAWRLQALAEGGLSERARRRAAELANDANLRLSPPRLPAQPLADCEPAQAALLRFQPDDRLPPAGTVLTRPYKDDVVQVKVLATGFEYRDVVYPSLSAVAKAVTGSHCNGYLFFRLGGRGGRP